MSNNSTNSLPALERWPTALAVELIGPALAQVEIALNHGNREEAYAAIDRAFQASVSPDEVTLDSPIVDLGLPVRLVNALEHDGAFTVGELCGRTATDIVRRPNIGPRVRRPNIGPRNLDAIRLALGRHGLHLREELVAVTNLKPLSQREWLDNLARRTA